MANIKSQIKRNKQNDKRRLRNRVFRGAARTAIKNARVELTEAEVKAALGALDKAAQKGAIHPRNAARRKSRLMKAAIKTARATGTKSKTTKTKTKKK